MINGIAPLDNMAKLHWEQKGVSIQTLYMFYLISENSRNNVDHNYHYSFQFISLGKQVYLKASDWDKNLPVSVFSLIFFSVVFAFNLSLPKHP